MEGFFKIEASMNMSLLINVIKISNVKSDILCYNNLIKKDCLKL